MQFSTHHSVSRIPSRSMGGPGCAKQDKSTGKKRIHPPLRQPAGLTVPTTGAGRQATLCNKTRSSPEATPYPPTPQTSPTLPSPHPNPSLPLPPLRSSLLAPIIPPKTPPAPPPPPQALPIQRVTGVEKTTLRRVSRSRLGWPVTLFAVGLLALSVWTATISWLAAVPGGVLWSPSVGFSYLMERAFFFF